MITVNWNGLGHLQSLLPSLERLEAGELIVVDNGSTDGSQQWLRREHPGVRLLENPVNEGFAQPCNRAAEAAGRPVLALINNDMRAHPDWLRSALPRLEGDAACVACRILDWEGRRVDFNGSSLQYLGYATQKDAGRLLEEVSSPGRVLFPCGGAMLVSRRVFLELGGFDADFFAIFEDVDLGWRLWSAGYEVAFAPESLVHHRGHASFRRRPAEKVRYLMHRNALLTALKNYEEPLFRKLLPLALVLAVKRAVVFSGVRKEGFHLWEETRHGLELGDERVAARVLDALNHLVAADDVLDTLERTLAKREQIQARRRRSDREILRLFEDPLRVIVDDPEYRRGEARWLERLDLLNWPGRPAADWEKEALSSRRRQLRRLDRELEARQWLAGHAATTPPPAARRDLKGLLGSLRRMGLPAAWRQFVETVNRGI